MSHELDWTTPAGEISLIRHWRIVTCIIGGVFLSGLIWHICFPHAHTFMKFWAGSVTGATVGLLTGAKWQFRDEKRREITSGRFLAISSLGWGFFSIITFLWLMPEFVSQEKERSSIRHWTSDEISSITIQLKGLPPRVVEERMPISEFVKLTRNAELFHPSHEGSIREFELTINQRDGESIIYQARIPERHQRDLSLRNYNKMSAELLIPESRHWIETALE